MEVNRWKLIKSGPLKPFGTISSWSNCLWRIPNSRNYVITENRKMKYEAGDESREHWYCVATHPLCQCKVLASKRKKVLGSYSCNEEGDLSKTCFANFNLEQSGSRKSVNDIALSLIWSGEGLVVYILCFLNLKPILQSYIFVLKFTTLYLCINSQAQENSRCWAAKIILNQLKKWFMRCE